MVSVPFVAAAKPPSEVLLSVVVTGFFIDSRIVLIRVNDIILS